MIKQYGFYFDQSRCVGCRTCAVACKEWNALPPGPLKHLRIYEYEKGSFPFVRLYCQWIPCYHCIEPACLDACPVEAIEKESRFGAVLIDEEACIGCRQCYDACPYGAIVFESDQEDCKARKCTMCIDRLVCSEQPICVLSCPMRALDFGPLNVLEERYGGQRMLDDLPGGETTSPAVVFRPQSEKRQVVPYDAERALELLAKRDPLPPVFTSAADVTEIPEGLVGRNQLCIKHDTTDDLMRCTRNDEG